MKQFVLKSLLLLLLFTVALPVAAQQMQKFHIESFGENSFDMSAREKPTSRDDGTGKLYAIIKVRSTVPEDDLKAYELDFDYLKDVQEMHDGILWVYVQYGAKTVTIKRDGFYTVERYDLKTTLQPGKVYDMKIKPEPKVISMQFLMFEVTPADCKGTVMFAEEGGAEKLFGQLDDEGIAVDKLVLGRYSYRIISKNYHDSEGIVTLSTPNGKHIEQVTLRPNFARITLSVENSAEIYINGERKGAGSWSGNLSPGTYSIECRKDNHKSTTETITVVEGKNTTHALKAPTPIVGVLSLTSAPMRAKITVDGIAHGETPNIIEGLLIGNHKVTLSKEGYETATVDITIRENETTEHKAQLTKNENTTFSGKGAGGNTFTVNGVSFKMIPVKGGTFSMGATSEQQDSYSSEKPVHSVTLSDYYIAETEVTQALWQAVMGSNPSYFKGKNNPVEKVSYYDCKAFINKLNTLLANQLPAGRKFRLPTEAEWEYAARGGSQSKGYKYSGSNTFDDVAWYDSNSRRKTHPVKQKQPNELGIYDMSGNVYEWCSDWYGGYSSSAQTNPTGPSSGSHRVLRGGSWYHDARYCRGANRGYDTPNGRYSNYGMRLALGGSALEQRSASSAQSLSKTSAPYKIGDYYNDGTKEGIVFEISNGGYSGKIVSLKEEKLKWSEVKVETNATSETDGMYNMQKIRSLSNWQNDYPAFAWCASLGDGWYLPALDELKAISAQRAAINNTLKAKGKSEFENSYYWSSTQDSEFSAWNVLVSNGNTFDNGKDFNFYVRAVSAFGTEDNASSAQSLSKTSAPYKVGDYYNDGTKEGIVFEVTNGGYSGKIVSLEQNKCKWSEKEVDTGATSKRDGMYNMQNIRSLENWQNDYPPFAWCVSLGDGWYLPALDELKAIYAQLTAINNTLKAKGKPELGRYDTYWSSTQDGFYAWGVGVSMNSGNRIDYSKGTRDYVRAVSAFGTEDNASSAQSLSKTSAPYKIGDYYNDGTKEGIVFEISNGGYNGKIVSLKEEYCKWSFKSVKTDATSETDGMYNMQKIRSLNNWQNDYPAFAWCASLGDEWYLPALKELKAIYAQRTAINKALKAKEKSELAVDDWHWPSTQDDGTSAWRVYMSDGYTVSGPKTHANYVRAVSAF